jgi:ATP-dependent Clp protease ATP-binding subunit ClpX
MEYKAGARSLRGIFEEMMTGVLYAIPDTPGLSEVIITSLFEEAQLISQPSPAT